MEGKISVIVLAHGDEKELIRCVDRILNQNYKDYELIVVSTYRNLELEEKANNNDLMTLYIKDVDKLEELRTYALNKADGDRVLFVEPNDFLIDEKSITILNEVYTQKNADMLLNKFMILRDGKFYFTNKKIENVSSNKFLFYQFDNIEFRKLAGVLLKKSLFGKIDSNDLLKPDQVLLNSLSREAQNIVFDCQNKYVYDEVNGNRLPELITGKESELYFSNIYRLVRKIKKSNYTSKISEKVSIALCIDENLVEHVGVLLYSISVNTSSFVDVYIIHDNLSYSSLEKLTELDKSFPTIKINIIKIPDNIQNQLNKISLEGNKLPVTSCYRFILADLLPSLDRIIYLDVDTLVLRDLTELWRTDLEGKFIGVVKDVLINLNVAQKIVSERKSYFNSGMLLMDLNLFRKYDICSNLIDFAIDVAEYCEYGDQDILNYYFIDGYKLLDIKWNCGRELLEGREKEVGIVHYYGLEKPWKFGMASIFYIKKSHIDMIHTYKLYEYRFLQKVNGCFNDRVTIIVKLDTFKHIETIDSILLQNYKNVDIKVIDTSQDIRVRGRVKKLQLYYPRLRYYEVTQNDNISRVMNFVVRNANGNIFYAKSKYLFLSNTITDLRKVMIENQADIVTAGEKEFNADKRGFYRIQRDDKVVDISDRKEVEVSSLNGCLIKKEIFDGIDDLNLEDNKLVNRILEKANKVMLKNSDYLIKLID